MASGSDHAEPHMEVMKAMALMTELVDSLALLRFSVLEPPPNENDAKCYQGIGAGWFVTLASWKLEGSGADNEKRGYDGMFVRDGTVVRLTRDVAEKVFRWAADKSESRP